jgi:DNA-binding beta-propeller fold protein YncE
MVLAVIVEMGGQATSAELNGPSGIALDATGNLYFAEESNNRVRIVNTLRIINTFVM